MKIHLKQPEEEKNGYQTNQRRLAGWQKSLMLTQNRSLIEQSDGNGGVEISREPKEIDEESKNEQKKRQKCKQLII